MLGIGGNINANTIAQISGGKVFNPYTEQLFNNMTFRSHSFNFKLFNRSPEEARENFNIIKYFKTGAVPILGKGASRFIEVPDKFDIKFVRMNPERTQFTDANDLHFKIFSFRISIFKSAFAETSMSLEDGKGMLQVPAVVLTLNFLETRFVGQEDIVEGY